METEEKRFDDEMPFRGEAFWDAVDGWDDGVITKYLRCIWRYYHHTHAQGLTDCDEELRRICRCDLADWNRVKGKIFDNDYFFRLENGKWHQPRAARTHAKCRERYEKNLAKTEPARNAVLVAKTVTSKVTDEEWLKSLKDNDCYKGIDIDRELGKLAAWCQANGKQASRRRFVNWLNRAEKPLQSSPQAPTKAHGVYALKTILEAKEKSAKAIYDRHASPTATGNEWTNDTERKRYLELKREIKQMNEQISRL